MDRQHSEVKAKNRPRLPNPEDEEQRGIPIQVAWIALRMAIDHIPIHDGAHVEDVYYEALNAGILSHSLGNHMGSVHIRMKGAVCDYFRWLNGYRKKDFVKPINAGDFNEWFIRDFCYNSCVDEERVHEKLEAKEAVEILRSKCKKPREREAIDMLLVGEKPHIVAKELGWDSAPRMMKCLLQRFNHIQTPPPERREIEIIMPEPTVRPEDIRPMHIEEKEILQRALHATKGSVTAAAKLLEIGRATFYRKIDLYGIKWREGAEIGTKKPPVISAE
jgi:hypothetical protein